MAAKGAALRKKSSRKKKGAAKKSAKLKARKPDLSSDFARMSRRKFYDR